MSTSDDDGNQSDDRTCPECGREFSSEHGVRIHYGSAHDGSLRPSIECQWCGDEFDVQEHRLGRAKYCSKECHSAHKRGGEKPSADTLRRLHWGEQLPVLKMAGVLGYSRSAIERWMDDYGIERRGRSEAEKLKWQQMTPEERAQQVAAAHEAVGQAVENGDWHLQTGNPEREGYGEGWTEEKKERVREMYDRTCQGCGDPEEEHVREYGRRLDVHHIIPAGYFDDPERRNAVENLVPLCYPCHVKWEGIPLRPELAD